MNRIVKIMGLLTLAALFITACSEDDKEYSVVGTWNLISDLVYPNADCGEDGSNPLGEWECYSNGYFYNTEESSDIAPYVGYLEDAGIESKFINEYSDDLFTDKTCLYEMLETQSIDVDTRNDLDIVQFLLKKKNDENFCFWRCWLHWFTRNL